MLTPNYLVRVCSVASVMSDSAILRSVACQDPLSMGFSRQGYWSGLPCPPPGDLPNPGIEPSSLKSPVLTGRFFSTSTTWEAPSNLGRPHHHLPTTSPSTKQKNVHKLITHPSSSPCLYKPFPESHCRVWVFGALAALLGVPLAWCLQQMLHFLSPQPDVRRLAFLCSGKQT